MPFFSKHDDLFIGDNYTRGQLSKDLMGMKVYPGSDIERGIYKPDRYSSIFLFSTINNWQYYNARLSDDRFLFSGNGSFQDNLLVTHKITNNEVLLFIRLTEETGFYYFGCCEYLGRFEKVNYGYPLYEVRLMNTKFSHIKDIEVPEHRLAV